jgi:hypothetical protein
LKNLLFQPSHMLLVLASPLTNIYNYKLEIFNVCMFIIISLWFYIFHMLFVIWVINAPIIDVIN